MDIKRTLLWVVFSVSGVMLYNSWQIQNGKPPLFGPAPQVQVANKEEANKQNAGANATPSATPTQNTNAPADVKTATQTTAVESKTITLKNDVLDLQIDTRGGSIVKATLLKHIEGKDPIVIFKTDGAEKYLARSGLVATGLDLPNHNDIFNGQASADGKKLTLTSEKNGVMFEKIYELKDQSYVLETTNKISNKSNQNVSPSFYAELIRDGKKIDESQFYSTFTGPAVYTEKEKFQKIEFSDIEKNKVTVQKLVAAGESGWVSMVQHYFASAWIPETTTSREYYFDRLETNLYRAGVKASLGELAPGASKIEKAQLFVGPQEEKMLEEIAPGLELVKDYGWLTILAKPIFWLLTKIHDVIANWGWSIVILTVLIKLAFFPLSAASYKSMARMKEVQPRLLQMKEQYKNEPQKLNQAMMKMYREEKINPLGGCLPVVVQIPVFISLYWVLLASVEMKNAPWVAWITDLSKPDPFYILPVIMAVSMFIQTKLNPTPPDPIQAKVMTIMPLVFSVMFFFFPAGLVLYWVVNNILSIAQQWQINRMFGLKKKA
jgi:YidC/Oxa1 family membrane protein insertase